MANWTSLSVKESTRDRFNDKKKAFNNQQDDSLPDLSADQYLQMLMDTHEHAQDGGYSDSEVNASEIVDELEDAMNQISMANEPGVTVDESGLIKEIRKAQELAEQARDNTEAIKQGLR